MPSCAAASEIDLSPSLPKFIVKLSLNEFSVLNVAEMDGLIKYGGSAAFQLSMAREGTNDVAWTVTVDNPRLMELVSIFVGEKTVKLVQSLDPSSIDSNQQLALQAVKSLTLKLEAAQKNPVWDAVTIIGYVMQKEGDWQLVSKDGVVRITGMAPDRLKKMDGRPVVATGFLKVRDEFEVTSLIEQRKNTLELFVMSLCPFGQKAETSIFNLIAQTNLSFKPAIDVRYIFYRLKKDEKDVWASLHGEEEIAENLVQMLIRDRFSKCFVTYLRLRNGNSSAQWTKLAEQAGLSTVDVAEIKTAVGNERETLIEREYDYAINRYDIRDGSPTFVWESQRISSLKRIEQFKGFDDASHEACTQ